MPRIKVLLIAEAANPQWVSVPLVGWSHSQALSRVADTHLVTHTRNRQAIVDAGWREGVDFTAINSDRVAGPLHWLSTRLRGGEGLGWTTVTALESLAYYYFEWLVWRKFGRAIREGAYDVVHRLTPLSPTAASRLARKCAGSGVPFVVGPLNGGLPWPRGFEQARRREREWLTRLRGLHRYMPGYQSTRRCAAAIITGSLATREQVPAKYRHKTIYLPENAIDPDRFPQVIRRTPKLPIRVAFVGRLVPYKNADVVVEAAAPFVNRGEMVVDIIGDGPMRGELAQLIERQQTKGIHLHGWLPHETVHARLGEADVFAFASIREFGGGAVLEAMAMGAAPIVVNYGGPGELVNDASGWRLPLARREQLVASMRQVFGEIVADPQVLVARREAAMQRVRRFYTWDVKAKQVLQIYEWVLGERAAKPDFGLLAADAPAPAPIKVSGQLVPS